MAEVSHSASGPTSPSRLLRDHDGPRQYISKTFVAYLEGLVVVTPYHRGTADPRASGYAEEVAADVFESTVRQAQRGQEIGIHGLLEAQARRMVPGGGAAAPKRPATARRAPDDDDEPLAPGAGAAGAPEDGASTSAISYAID